MKGPGESGFLDRILTFSVPTSSGDGVCSNTKYTLCSCLLEDKSSSITVHKSSRAVGMHGTNTVYGVGPLM